MVFPTHKFEEANRLEEFVHTRHSTVARLPREAGDLGASQVMQENVRYENPRRCSSEGGAS